MAISNIGAKNTITMALTTAAKAVVDAYIAPEADAVGLAVTTPAANNEVGFGAAGGSTVFGVIESYDRHTGLVALSVQGVMAVKLKAKVATPAALGCNDAGQVVALTGGSRGVLLCQDEATLVGEVLL